MNKSQKLKLFNIVITALPISSLILFTLNNKFAPVVGIIWLLSLIYYFDWREENLKKPKLIDRLYDIVVFRIFFDWIFRPVVYFIGLSVLGIITLWVFGSLANHDYLDNLENWQRLGFGFIIGLLLWALWQAREEKSPDRGSGR